MTRMIRGGCCLLMLLLLCACAQGDGVQWTGLEWNGSTEGEYPNRNCDIVQIGREAPRTDSIPYPTLKMALQGAVEYRKELSDRYLLLSQTSWRFRLYDSPELFDKSADTDFFSARLR